MSKKKRRKGKQAAWREWMKSLAADILSGVVSGLILAAIGKWLGW